MDEGTQTDLVPTVVRFLSESECSTMSTKSLKSAAARELLPSVIGSVALVAPDASPTPSSTTTTSAAAASGNTTSKLMLDLGDDISVGPATAASVTTSGCVATLPNIDMAPQASTAVYADSTTRYHSQSPDDDSDEEILNIRLLVDCETESAVDKCPDGLDCPFCEGAPLCASDCDSDMGEMLQVNRVKDGPLLPTTEILTDTTAKSPAELLAAWFEGQPNFVMQPPWSAPADGEWKMCSQYVT